jgi:hypothetical protein
VDRSATVLRGDERRDPLPPAWHFTAQDPFFMTWPVGSVLGDDPAPRPSYPTRVVPTTEVFGLGAKIVCALSFADFGEPEPPRASGTPSDVKVLLRRW